MARLLSNPFYSPTQLLHYSTTYLLLQHNHLIRLLEIPEPERVEIRAARDGESFVIFSIPYHLAPSSWPLFVVDERPDFLPSDIVNS